MRGIAAAVGRASPSYELQAGISRLFRDMAAYPIIFYAGDNRRNGD